MNRLRVGFYGDDFTGSVDALLQYRRTGLTGVLVTDPRHLDDDLVAGRDVVGIAGVARALPTSELAAEVVPAVRALVALGPKVIQYKASSTGDSSVRTGSLGAAIEICRGVLGGRLTPVLLAQPDFGRYTVFGTHFAADADGVYRLDRHPTMSRHPVSPMAEADLVRFLGGQTTLTVANLPLPGRHPDPTAPGVLNPGSGTPGSPGSAPADIVVLDALREADLSWAGRAILSLPEPVFALGSGGLSRAVGLALGGTAGPLPDACPPASGPVLVVSGSCSALTWRQVQDAAGSGWRVVDALAEPQPAQAARSAFADGVSVVVHSARPGGPEAADEWVAGLLADVVYEVAGAARLSRVVVAGGDTSGRVLRLLGVTAVEIVATPWRNAALCRATGGVLDGVEVVLKGGQMGPSDLFERVRAGSGSLPAGGSMT